MALTVGVEGTRRPAGLHPVAFVTGAAERREMTSPFIVNLRVKMPLCRKLYLVLRNTGIKIRKRQDCCGHPGEPGC